MRYLITLLLFVCSSVWANDLFIYYTSSESSQYSNLKGHYEGLGFTVTGSTSTTVSSTDLSGKEMVIDITGNSNCGSTCRSVYDTYVSGGGKLIIAAENGATNRQSNIESLIEDKMQVGSMTYYSTWSDDGYQSIARGDYATSGQTTLPGTDGLFSASGGTPMASNTSTSTWHTWYKWDYGSNGGTVIVTTGYGQFLSTSYNADNMDTFLTAIATEEGLYSSSPTTSTTTGTSGGITSAQSTAKSQARTRAGNFGDGKNTIYIDQVGSSNTVSIEQDGTAGNHIRGIYLNGNDFGKITGSSNSVTMKQGADTSSDINLIEFSLIGDTNDILLYQDRLNTGYEDTLAGGGHTIQLDVNGDLNDIDIIQRNNYSTNGGHHVNLEVDGDSNVIDLKQISDYGKSIFGKVTGNSSNISVYQEGDANKYLDFDLTGNGHTLDVDQLGTGAHNAEITLINGSAASSVTLTQQGSTAQSYSIEQTCYTVGGCSTTVTQGN